MKYRDPETGLFRDLTLKVADSLPVGTIVDYDGNTIPDGWEEVSLTPTVAWGNITGSVDSQTDLTNAFVSKTGDAMTGDLFRKCLDVDATAADNDVSYVHYPTTSSIVDKNDNIIGRLETIVRPDGDIDGYWYIRNYDTNGNMLGQKGIRMIMDKSGNFSYDIDNGTKFCEAINAVKKSGDTMTGALNFANGIKNVVGDDVSIGDFNVGGTLGIMGEWAGANTGIALLKPNSSWDGAAEYVKIEYNATDKCIEFIFKDATT